MHRQMAVGKSQHFILISAADVRDYPDLDDQVISCFQLAHDLIDCVADSLLSEVPASVWTGEVFDSAWSDNLGPLYYSLFATDFVSLARSIPIQPGSLDYAQGLLITT